MTDVLDAAFTSTTAPDGAAGTWSRSHTHRFLALGGSRAFAQLLAMAWFVAAARILTDAQYGVVATGMAFFAVFAGVGDVGTTRTLVRHVAAEPRMVWTTYRAAVGVRVAGGLAIGLGTAGVVAIAPVPIDASVVVLAALMATASGVTELGYAALRSIGRVRVEAGLLVAERAVFLVVGLLLVLGGAGPMAVLGLYVATNAVSAVIMGLAVRRNRPDDELASDPMFDVEARWTAAGFALVTVSPRIGPVLVALFASATAVGVYAAAQRPIEAICLFTLSTAAPLLPVVRSLATEGRQVEASRIAVRISAAILLALAPVVTWFLVDPATPLRLFFGEGRYEGAAIVLRVLSITALTWCFRGIGELVLLSNERARRLLHISGTGGLATVALGVPLVIAHGASGAAWATLLAEVVMVTLLLRHEPSLGGALSRRAHAPVVAAISLTVVVVVLLRGSVPATLVALGLVQALAIAGALRMVRNLEQPA